MSENYCHCCGLPMDDYMPWGDDGQTPDWTICECCGIEYGYQDCSESALLKFRKEWLGTGGEWREPKLKPKN